MIRCDIRCHSFNIGISWDVKCFFELFLHETTFATFFIDTWNRQLLILNVNLNLKYFKKKRSILIEFRLTLICSGWKFSASNVIRNFSAPFEYFCWTNCWFGRLSQRIFASCPGAILKASKELELVMGTISVDMFNLWFIYERLAYIYMHCCLSQWATVYMTELFFRMLIDISIFFYVIKYIYLYIRLKNHSVNELSFSADKENTDKPSVAVKIKIINPHRDDIREYSAFLRRN